MQAFQHFLHQNAASLFMLWLLVAIAMMARFFFQYQRTRLVFPKLPPERIRFDQRTASGRSFKTWFTRHGGASRCLHVRVTDTEVWLRLIFPFNVLGQQCDLEHRIPKTSIVRLEIKASRFFPAVLLDYRDQRGQIHQFSLILKKPGDFISAIGGMSPG